MTRISISTLMFFSTILVVFYACGSKKQVARQKTSPSVISIEPIVPLALESFRLSYQPPRFSPPKKIITSKDYYELAYRELEEMLVGIRKPDFERAVFISENPYHSNQYSYQSFQKCIDVHLYSIQALIAANDKSDSMDFNVQVNEHGRFRMDDIRYLPKEKNELYRKALTNWAIFKYMTDTTFVYPFYHLPFTYATHDPFGMKDWSSSQVIGLLKSDENKGNCFSLTAFYKILADRLNAGARLCTAPQHIYIQHQDPKGDYYNVELATGGHPSDGTIQTLTYSTSNAIRNGISMRSYNEKQNIGLCLINLAKSYEHTHNTKGHVFLLQCAELVLKHDSLNLNALLLKQQVLDAWITDYAAHHKISDITTLKTDMRIAQTVLDLEKHIALLYRLGYRQMPIEMQEIIMTGNYPKKQEDRNPSPFTTIDPKDPHRKQFQTLYSGLFTEVFNQKKSEVFGHFTFSTQLNTFTRFDISVKNNMIIDPVAFAYDFGARMYDPRLGRWMSTDPLAIKYPELTPYNFVGNSPILLVDIGGLTLVVHGTITEFNKFKAAIEVEYAGLITVQRDQNNVVTFLVTEKAKELANNQNKTVNEVIAQQTVKKSYEIISKIMDPNIGTTDIQLMPNDGQFLSNAMNVRQEIYMDTHLKLGQAEGLSAIASVIHELEEGFQYQVVQGKPKYRNPNEKRTKSYLPAHAAALIAEAQALGVDKVEHILDVDPGGTSGQFLYKTYKTSQEGNNKFLITTTYAFILQNGKIDLTPRENEPNGYSVTTTREKIK